MDDPVVVVVAGVLFAIVIRDQVIRRRYGGWKVLLLRDGEPEHPPRSVSPVKAKQCLDMPEELSVFLKGVVSGTIWLNCDLVTEGRECGMLVEDKKARTWTIHLDKNPPPKRPPATAADVVAAVNRLQNTLSTYTASSTSVS